MASDVVYLGKMSKVCAHQTLTNTHTHTRWEREGGLCTCAAARHPSCFSRLAQCSICLNLCHFSSLRSTAIQPPPRLRHFTIIMWCMWDRNLLNTVPVTAQTLPDINDVRLAPVFPSPSRPFFHLSMITTLCKTGSPTRIRLPSHLQKQQKKSNSLVIWEKK